ncbi:MAG: Sec-independent protein translocase protein TatB [Ignavibacteria bacterium]
MFDVGFSELVVIALVALIVIGPERLPKVARTAGILLGRLQRYVNDVKADINREIQLEELKKMQADVAEKVRDMEQSVNAQLKTVETELNESIVKGIEEKAASPDAPAEAAAVALPAASPAAEMQPAEAVPAPAAPVAAAPTTPADKPQA